jgi:hypothetical protein
MRPQVFRILRNYALADGAEPSGNAGGLLNAKSYETEAFPGPQMGHFTEMVRKAFSAS